MSHFVRVVTQIPNLVDHIYSFQLFTPCLLSLSRFALCIVCFYCLYISIASCLLISQLSNRISLPMHSQQMNRQLLFHLRLSHRLSDNVLVAQWSYLQRLHGKRQCESLVVLPPLWQSVCACRAGIAPPNILARFFAVRWVPRVVEVMVSSNNKVKEQESLPVHLLSSTLFNNCNASPTGPCCTIDAQSLQPVNP